MDGCTLTNSEACNPLTQSDELQHTGEGKIALFLRIQSTGGEHSLLILTI